MTSLYWDDFERRADETVSSIKNGALPPVGRVAVFITNKCNFKCKYCNHSASNETLSEEKFNSVVQKYGSSAIIHITGGEPSVVPWLYPYLKTNGHKYRFHLNTNGYIQPPADSVKRLKISLDSYDGAYWDCLVGRSGAFASVCNNIKFSSERTITSITYTLTKENYKHAAEFARFSKGMFPKLYAIFFSIYKGCDTAYSFDSDDVELFFVSILPKLERELGAESVALLRETIDEKRRLLCGVRFPEQVENDICFLSMSERVISPSGKEYTCSHLYRDGIYNSGYKKHEKCLYGCNRRLVQFNQHVQARLF